MSSARPPIIGPGIPARLGRFTVHGLIARGSSGLVLNGSDPSGLPVAIKLAERGSAARSRRFRAEIRACQQLDHPGIIKIHAVGEYEGRPWYAMDFHGQVTLRDLLASAGTATGNDLMSLIQAVDRGGWQPTPTHGRPLPLAVALALIHGIGEAIGHAHDRGLVHRDLKPENVLLRPDGQPVVCDFGLVKDLGRQTAHHSATAGLHGTLGYLAPEQRTGLRAIDERVDIYALGVILGELVTGLPPRLDDELGPGRPARGSRELDRDLRLIIHRATHRDPQRRYHSLQAFLNDLRRYQQGEAIRARPDRWRQRLADLVHEHRVVAVTLALVGLLVLSLATARWILARLDASRWGRPLADRSFRYDDEFDDLRPGAGDWTVADQALRSRGTGPFRLTHPQALASDLRLQVTLQVVPPTAPVELFIANAEATTTGGLRWQLLPPDRWRIWRDDILLEEGTAELPTDGRWKLEWELAERHLRGRLADRQLCELPEASVWRRGWAGLALPQADQVAVTHWEIRARTVPTLSAPSDLGQHLIEIGQRLPLAERAPLQPILAEEIGPQDSRLQACWLATPRLAPLDPKRTNDLLASDLPVSLAGDLAWWQLRRSPDTGPLAALWADPSERRRCRSWAIGRCRIYGPALAIAVSDRWRSAEAHLAPVAIRHDLISWGFWHDEAWTWAATADADTARAADWWAARMRADGAHGEAAGSLPLLQRWALFQPWAEGPVVPGVAALLARADGRPAQASDLPLTTAEQAWLQRWRHQPHPPSTAWRDPSVSDAALIGHTRRFLQEPTTIANLMHRAGPQTRAIDWPRLLTCRFLYQAATGDPADSVDTLPTAWLPRIGIGAGLQLWSLGLARRLARGDALDLTAAPYPNSIRALLVAMHSGIGLDRVAVPVGRPDRPSLALALAVASLRHGATELGQARLRALARHAAIWPEGLVAELLLAADATGQ